jgi:LPS-assembly lipoprotein
MSLFNRRHIISALAILPLGACMFKPAYGPGEPALALSQKVVVADPTNKNSFDFFQRLSNRLGIPKEPLYRLNYVLSTSVANVGISQANVLTRFNILGAVSWSLLDLTTDQIVISGNVKNFSSYSATSTTVAELAAKEDASLRLMRTLADQVLLEMIAQSQKLPKFQEQP